ncbi:MAG: 5-formyltetrahydrofolate cyclo-ligase [Alicyclobacillaceae bacterium]|nr:5-formyltetrahydrofolate cyclo-ligase [Alicyclobacillaceae bacterium]
MKAEKAVLRSRISAWRDGLAPEERRRPESLIVDLVEAWLESVGAGTLLAYVPIRSEVDIRPAVDRARRRGMTVAFPKVRPDGDLEAIPALRWEDLRAGAFGIPEPEGNPVEPARIDAVLVPGIAFDRLGRRLGYGKGYYDRFLRRVPGAAKAGVAFAGQWVDRLPADPHDVPVDYVITEEGIWDVRGGCFVKEDVEKR